MGTNGITRLKISAKNAKLRFNLKAEGAGLLGLGLLGELTQRLTTGTFCAAVTLTCSSKNEGDKIKCKQ